MLLGSSRKQFVTCAQDSQCEFENLRATGPNSWEWYSNDRIHVTDDESGFFLRMGEEKVVQAADGTRRVYTCSDAGGCAVNRLFLLDNTVYPEYNLTYWAAPTETINGSVVKLPPRVQTTSYPDLPAGLPHFSADHFELSDVTYYYINRPQELLRDEVICPGVGSRGRLCTIDNRRGGSRQTVSAGYVLEELEGKIVKQSDQPDSNGYFVFGPDLPKMTSALDKLASGQPLTPDEQDLFNGFNAVGNWGEYGAWGMMFIPDETLLSGRSIHSFAFGQLYEDFPRPLGNEGVATWRGGMLGWWSRVGEHDKKGGILGGTSEVKYHFADNTLDVTLTVADDLPGFPGIITPYTGRRVLSWENLRQNSDGSFFLQGNHKPNPNIDLRVGYIDGDFYGSNAEEVAGIFEQIVDEDHLQGSFGGKRQD